MRSIRPAIEELEKAFESFVPLFGREMPRPVITVQSKGRMNALGWFWKDGWANGEPGKLPEINLSAEHLAREPEKIAATLIHEMVHYANALDGVRDCTGHQYHNRQFKERAESVGLVVERIGGRGWATTSLSEGLRGVVREAGLKPEPFSLFRQDQEAGPAKTWMRKWRCDCTNIRAATEVRARCEKCGNTFMLQGQT